MTNINLPFEDQYVWNYLRWYSYLSEQHKLLYISTPKVACTSLKWWFADLEGYSQLLSEVKDSNQPDPDLVVHDSFHKVAPSVTGLMPGLLVQALVSDDYFRFAVVRNPYKRIFSAWQSKLLLREPYIADPYMKFDFFLMPIKNKSDIALAFEGFLEHLASHESPSDWDPHWAPQVNLLRPDLIAYTNIAQIENTKKLKLELTKHLGPDIPNPFASRRANESLIPYLPDLITERAAELIKSLYGGDFQTFGYDNQLPEVKTEFSSSELDVALQAINLIRGRHQRISEIRASLPRQIEHLNQDIVERERQIIAVNQAMVERERQIIALNQAMVERERQIIALNQAMVERERQIIALNQAMVECERQIINLTTQLNEIIHSKAWHYVQIYRNIRSRLHWPTKERK
jgi:hypothetical protein